MEQSSLPAVQRTLPAVEWTVPAVQKIGHNKYKFKIILLVNE